MWRVKFIFAVCVYIPVYNFNDILKTVKALIQINCDNCPALGRTKAFIMAQFQVDLFNFFFFMQVSVFDVPQFLCIGISQVYLATSSSIIWKL